MATDHYFESCGQTSTAIQQCPLEDTREDRTHVWNMEEPLTLSSQVGAGGGGAGSMMFRPKHCDPLYCGGGSNSIPQLLYCTTLSMVHRQNNRCHDYLRD